MMAENLNTCDCFGELGSSACNDWCDTTTKNVSLTSIQNINEPLFPDLLSDSTPPPQDTIDTSQCCKYQRLLQTWIRMGYTTFGLLSLFFIETIVKLAALPHLLSRKMEIADAMLGKSNLTTLRNFFNKLFFPGSCASSLSSPLKKLTAMLQSHQKAG